MSSIEIEVYANGTSMAWRLDEHGNRTSDMWAGPKQWVLDYTQKAYGLTSRIVTRHVKESGA